MTEVKIKNRDRLATSELRRKVLDIIEAGIWRVLPSTIMRSSLSFQRPERTLSVNNDVYQVAGRLFVVGGGKACGLMAQTLESITGVDTIEAGIVVDKASPAEFDTHKIRVIQAGHPIPDSRGVKAVQAMLHLKHEYATGKEELVLCLVSGGGSALMPCPVGGVSLGDKQQVTRLLLSCGADIYEINSVRKHLSRTKGGRLAQYYAPAGVLSLILSDVVGSDLSVIASGPTYPDSSTYSDAYAVLKKYDLLRRVPKSLLSILERGCRGEIEETPKSLDNVHNYIIGDNRMALEAMAEKARGLGFKPLIISSRQTGDTETVARQRAQEILDGTYTGYNALLIGGETTPTLPAEPGKGGRNQHYVALSLLLLEHYPGDWALASVGTDGSDFMPGVAGAIVDHESLHILKDRGVDVGARLEQYDSNTLLAVAGNSLIITGNTHTNVGDIMVYLV